MKDWLEVELKELSDYVIGGDWGKPADYDDVDFELAYCIRGADFKDWKKEKGATASVRKIKKRSLDNRALSKGDILIEISGGGPDQPVGRTVLIDRSTESKLKDHRILCTNFLRLFRPKNFVNSSWLNTYLSFFYNAGKTIKYQGGSNNLRNLKYKQYERIKVPIAPLPEQRAIVSKIEQLFSELDNGISNLKKAQEQLKVFRQAVLKKAFEDKSSYIPLKELAEITGGVTKGKKYKGKELIAYPYLRVANVQDGYLDLKTIKEIEVTKAEFEKYQLESGDVLFTEGGDKDKLGRGTVWKNEISGCIHQNHIFRARPDKQALNPYFLSYYAGSPLGKDYFFKNGKQTTNLASINKTILSSLPVPNISLEKQEGIVQEVESQLSICDKLEETISENLEKAEALRQSILKKAFEGVLLSARELVSCRQEPDWEPVVKLLERIRRL